MDRLVVIGPMAMQGWLVAQLARGIKAHNEPLMDPPESLKVQMERMQAMAAKAMRERREILTRTSGVDVTI